MRGKLADARAEIERLNSVDHYACALCPDVAQARQEAARTFLDLAEEYEGGKCELYDLVAKRFKLEG